jgi:hypothetical protein
VKVLSSFRSSITSRPGRTVRRERVGLDLGRRNRVGEPVDNFRIQDAINMVRAFQGEIRSAGKNQLTQACGSTARVGCLDDDQGLRIGAVSPGAQTEREGPAGPLRLGRPRSASWRRGSPAALSWCLNVGEHDEDKGLEVLQAQGHVVGGSSRVVVLKVIRPTLTLPPSSKSWNVPIVVSVPVFLMN